MTITLANCLDGIFRIGSTETILSYICINSTMQCIIWFFWRKNTWSLGKELFINQYLFWACIICCEITHYCLLYADANSQGSMFIRIFYYSFILFFINCYCLFTAHIYVDKICAEIPYKSERYKDKEKSMPEILSYLFGFSLHDAFFIYIVYYFLPDMHTMDDSDIPFEYIQAVIPGFVAIPVDFTFYLTHRYLLHGPAWSWHKEHHEQQRPTIFSGRIFSLSDWFSEFTSSAILVALPLGYYFTKPFGLYHAYIITANLMSSTMFSTLHHSGKTNIPCPNSYLTPWVEIFSLITGTSAGGLHEGHHNYITQNFGLVGYADRIFGTYKPPLERKKDKKA